jgi:hypothetical protein
MQWIMTRIATSIEESNELLELGINPNTADMMWKYNHNTHKHDDVPKVLTVKNWDDYYNKDIPAWSLSRLIELIPTEVKLCKTDSNLYFCQGLLHDSAIGAVITLIESLHDLGRLNFNNL